MSKITFILSLIIFAFWSASRLIDVYHFAVVGAIYEFLWIFMLVGLFLLPVISIIFLIKEGFKLRSFYLYTLIVTVTNILLMIFLKPGT